MSYEITVFEQVGALLEALKNQSQGHVEWYALSDFDFDDPSYTVFTAGGHTLQQLLDSICDIGCGESIRKAKFSDVPKLGVTPIFTRWIPFAGLQLYCYVKINTPIGNIR